MDWRASLTNQSRQEVIQKLIQIVKLAAPTQDQTKLAELAAKTEASIFEKSKTKQEYILLLQQKMSNLQAKIAVIQKSQGSFSTNGNNYVVPGQGQVSGEVSGQGANQVIAPKYPIGQSQMGMSQMGMSQMGQVGSNVPANLRNMVLNLQQQQAQNIKNSIKNQQAVQNAMQAAKISQKNLMGVQMASSSMVNSAPLSSPMQTSLHAPIASLQSPIQSPMQVSMNSPGQTQIKSGIPTASQSGSPLSNSISFPSLNLSDAQKADVTEKLKKIMPIYQKIDVIINYLSAAQVPAKNNIQKLLQLKNLLTEQYKSLKVRIFISADGLDNIYEFLLKMLQAVEEIRCSKISTPSKSIQTPTNIQKQENIIDAFKYAMEQELYLKKSNKALISPNPPITGSFNWTSELKMYGINSESFSFDKSCLDSVDEDYTYLFGSLDSVKQDKITHNSDEVPLDSEIRHLESLGFAITKLDDFKDLQVLLIKNMISNWTIILHVQNSIIKEWQLLQCPVSTGHDYTLKQTLNLDRNFLEGKSVEMVQFLQLS